MNSSRSPRFKDMPRTILLMAMMGWGLGLVLAMLAFGLNQGNDRDRAMLATRSWVALWTLPFNELPVTSVADCGQGPVPTCAVVVAPIPDGGDALVRTWPEQNWAKAWVPLSAWRVAHNVALRARESIYGQQVLDAGPEGVSRVPDPNGLRRTHPTPSWRLSMIVAPTDPSRSTEVDQAPVPTVSHQPYGPVVRFLDGMELPARQEDGRWYVLAQGPMDQAQRMAAALMGRADPGVSVAPKANGPTPSSSSTVSSGTSNDGAGPAPAARSISPSGMPFLAPSLMPNPAALPSARTPAVNAGALADRPDRANSRADELRDGERSSRPSLRSPSTVSGEHATGGAKTPAVLRATPTPIDRDERSRDREVLRHLPSGRRPMLDSEP